ncbi:MAG TPA: MG2 domain-containing protein, partial [Anaerolineae bacterium]|nr:MG2 domain-containing protein [Anaerolineae bacterium]
DWRQFSPNQPALLSWSLDPQTELDRDEKRDLILGPLEPGLYYLSLGSPEGAGDRQILISSGTALTLKRTSTQALVWATSVNEGHPVADLPVVLYDARGQVLATGVTDENGLFLADLVAPLERLYVFAPGEGDLGVCSDGWDEGIEPWRFEDVAWRWETSPRKYRAFLYTDRPTYSPGQEVNFRGVFRVDGYDAYRGPELGTLVSVTASNYQGDVISRSDLETGPFGTIRGSFQLDEEVKEGEYLLIATVGGEQYQAAFRIQHYEEEPFRVDWDVERDLYVIGEIISGTVSAEYEFGVPVRGASVDYTVYASEYSARPDVDTGQPGGCEGSSCWAYAREVAVGHGLTDEQGEFKLALRADAGAQGGSQLLTLEATVTNDAGQQVSTSEALAVHAGEFHIDLLPERFALLTGERAIVAVQTTDAEGKALADLELFYTIQVSEWETVPGSVRGDTYSSWQEIATDVERSRTTTDGEGRALISFVPRQGGAYRVEAWGRDGRGSRILDAAELWVGDTSRWVAWRFSEHDRVALIPDKESYAPAETARVLIQSPYKRATCLVTVEGAEILSHQLVELESNSAMLDIPLKVEYAPNVFVSVTLMPQDVEAGAYAGFKVGYAELEVQSTENQLRISMTPDQETYQPGQMASFTIMTRDYLNRPVSAELSLGVVDAPVLSASEDARLDMVNAFYGPRSLAVRTAQSLAIHAARKLLIEDYGGSGGIGEQELPTEFLDLAYWNPAVVTDERGVGQVSFQMPEHPTTMRAFARGVTASGLMGAADVEVLAYKPLALSASAPSFVYVGDTAMIRTLIENATGDPLAVQVIMSATAGLATSEAPRTALVEAGGRAILDWAVEAQEAGLATVTVVASAGEEHRDVVQRAVSVLPFEEQTRVMDAYVVEGEAPQTLSLPASAGPVSLRMDVAPSLAAALIGSVEYLMEQPVDSVEQTVSYFLAGLSLNGALAEQGISVQGPLSELAGAVPSCLQRLYRHQNRDGGWGWVEGGESLSQQTAYAVLGLKEARDAGYPVNERVLEGGLEFLRKVSVETRDLEEKAYISYVLSECGEGDLSLVRSLSERRRHMDLYAQAYLVLALTNLGDESSARRIADDLAARAIETAHTAHWTEERHDLAEMSSDGRTTAIVLRALLATDPDHRLLGKTVSWLMWERYGGLWRNTYETSEIVGALVAYLVSTGGGEERTGYQVYLDQELLVEGQITPEGMMAPAERVTRELAAGEHAIEVVGDGAAPLYISTVLEHQAARDLVEAARSLDGPHVERRYEVATVGQPLEGCAIGDLIRVRLLVEFPEDAWYVVLEDSVPPGTELVRISPLVTRQGGTSEDGFGAKGRADVQGVAFFTDWLPAGVYEYSYLVRATTVGDFRVMPAEASLMYDPGIWGRSSSGSLRVAGQP